MKLLASPVDETDREVGVWVTRHCNPLMLHMCAHSDFDSIGTGVWENHWVLRCMAGQLHFLRSEGWTEGSQIITLCNLAAASRAELAQDESLRGYVRKVLCHNPSKTESAWGGQ